MNLLADIARDPDWLPHRIDPAARRLELLRVPASAYREPGFLADYKPQSGADVASIPFEQLAALQPTTGPLHFIVHTAFCRSTLLARALNIEGVSVALAEPAIVSSLASAGAAADAWIAPVMRLLARARAGGEAVFVKPTNHANRIVPALIAACPEARVVVMTNALEVFLRSVARKGMMGRRWGRNLYLELQSYAAIDFGMDPRESFIMSDMQAAGLAWLLNQAFLAGLLAGPHGARMRVLDGDRFNAERARTLHAVLDFAQVAASEAQIAAAASGPAFASHAKLGGAFAEEAGAGAGAGADHRLEEEIAQVSQWIGLIAQQMGGDVPLKHTLF